MWAILPHMDPTVFLPHRPPFLLLDDVIVPEPGRIATGTWTPGPERFKGHFPGRPILPGVLQVEAIAQVGACALLAEDNRGLPLFGGIDKVRWKKQVTPGDTLTIEVTLETRRRNIGKGRGKAFVNRDLACDAQLMFIIVPHSPDPEEEPKSKET